MATKFSILAWGIPWTKEPGGLHFMGLQRFGHDLLTKKQQRKVHGGAKKEIIQKSGPVPQHNEVIRPLI